VSQEVTKWKKKKLKQMHIDVDDFKQNKNSERLKMVYSNRKKMLCDAVVGN
jgi:hypothetical protein